MAIWKSRPTYVGPVEYTVDQADLRAAYERGRHDERATRHHHPIIALAVIILAVIGAWLLFLGAREGSFSAAGPIADRQISTAAQEAQPVLRDTAAQTGEAIKDAGQAISNKSQDIVESQKR